MDSFGPLEPAYLCLEMLPRIRRADPSISEDRRWIVETSFDLKGNENFFPSDFVKSVLQLIGRRRLNEVDSLTTRGRVRVTNNIDSSCVGLFIFLLEDSR